MVQNIQLVIISLVSLLSKSEQGVVAFHLLMERFKNMNAFIELFQRSAVWARVMLSSVDVHKCHTPYSLEHAVLYRLVGLI